MPSILVLLLTGILLGPVTGWLEPDALFGDLLLPFVSLSVGIILFEGGLSLRLVELDEIGSAVRNLVTVGVLTTWVVAAVAANVLLGLPLGIAVLLGAILVVTGPTVILPLLRQLRPKGAVGKVLKWEGILIDPIGVVLAVLVFEGLLVGGLQATTQVVVVSMGKALAAGTILGALGGFALASLLRRHLIPDHLENPTVLGLVVAVFAVCEYIQPESGLIGATVMGFVIANQDDIAMRDIVEFKENLRILLISFLFLVLAARLEVADLVYLSWASLGFLAVLFLVARPLGVFLSTVGTDVSRRGRVFLAGMAPRGIVAAAISSVFAIELADRGVAGAEALVPVTFAVIIATVAVYGLAAGPLARLLDVGDPDPQGALIVGASGWTLTLAKQLDELGVRVLVVDTNPWHLRPARQMGLETYEGSLLHESARDEIEFSGLGKLLALTPNDEVNALVTTELEDLFDRRDIYQIGPPAGGIADEDVQPELRGRLLFGDGITYEEVAQRFSRDWSITTTEIPPDGPVPDLRGDDRIVMAIVRDDGSVEWVTAEDPPTMEGGDHVVQMVKVEADPLPTGPGPGKG